jgi:hypothetical protein
LLITVGERHWLLYYPPLIYPALFIFLTRLQNKSATANDSIFIDTSKFPNYVVSPIYNGLSDHDGQLIMLSDIDIKIQNPKFKIIRRIDTYSVLDF